jgi:16S rRNA (cytidine1402-2'-O)-methyltransferase
LIPAPLGDVPPAQVLPAPVIEIAAALDTFIVERPKTARAFLKSLNTRVPLQQIALQVLDEHTPPSALPILLAPLLEGRNVGLVSEAGCPGVADPGASLVALAHEQGVEVVPLVGPSAILLALMASGLSGQRFAFNGYLPADADGRERALRELERRASLTDETQIFIETPYRNAAMLNAILRVCRPETRLCVAADLTLPGQMVRNRSVAAWKSVDLSGLRKRPAVFLLHRG